MASDGSYGNFTINAGGGLTEITGVELTETNPDFYKVNLSNQVWSVLGVRDNNAASFWYLEFYDDIGFTNMVQECHHWQYVNYIVVNGHNYPTGWYGVKPWNTTVSQEADIQWDNDIQFLYTNTTHNKTWTYNHVSKIWNIHLTPDDYYFELDLDSLSNLDLDMALFKWGGDNIFDMDEDEISSSNFGFGVDESFHYSPVTAGDYGLCITSKNYYTDDFDINIYTAGRWSGAVNTDWHNPANWTSSSVPSHDNSVVIPSGCSNYPSAYSETAYCKNMTIEAGASLTVNNKYMNIYGDLQVFGELKMLGQYGELTVENSITWEAGSTANIMSDYCIINCYRNWKFNAGTLAQIDNGTVRFVNTLGSYIINHSATSYLNDVIIDKTNGTLWYNVLSTENLKIIGDFTVNSGSTFKTDSELSIMINGSFTTNGTLNLNAGTVEFVDQSIVFDLNSGDYFNNIRIAASAVSMLIEDMYLKGDLVIDGGGLIALSNDIYIGGSWYNNLGPDYFLEGTGTVIFNISDESYCYGEEFYELELLEGGLNIPSGTTTCGLFKYTGGYLNVSGGTFTANDLYYGWIDGEITLSDGEINLHQDFFNSVHLDADLYISGGTLNIYGGAGDSYWPGSKSIEIHMDAGVIDFKDVGINIWNYPSATIYNEITGGIIRTSGNLTCNRTDFNLDGGTFELYGPDPATVSCVPQSHFFNINIDKNATKSNAASKLGKPGNQSKSPKSNDVSLTSDLHITGDLNIVSGSLDIDGNILVVDNDLNIDAVLIMNNSSDVVHVHGDIFWNQNSVANVTDGHILAEGGFYVLTGANVQFGINNTLKFLGAEISGISNSVTGTSFGDLQFNKTDNYTILNPSSHYINVNGDVLVHPNNEVRISGSLLECNGTFYGDDFCNLIVDNNATIEANSTFNLDGYLTINSGLVVCHDLVQISTAASMNINGGSCIWDRPYSATYFNLFGDVLMNDGVFEVTNDGINMGPTAEIAQDGGTVKIGWGIFAVYPNNFLASDGTVEFIGPQTGIISFEASNYMHNLTINRTSAGGVNIIDNLTINNDLTINNNQLSTGTNDVTIGGDLTIAPTGVFNATYGDVYIGGDWINNAGDAGFLEGTNLVTFEGGDNSHIINDETFYDVDVSINGGSSDYVWADPNTTINILGDLNINSCSFRLDANATVNIEGDLIINENTNLFASTNTNTYINLKGNWYNYNTTGYPWVNGFYYGLSTVNFTGEFEAGLTASCGLQDFYNLKISKGTADFFPYSDIIVYNDLNIFGGNWAQDESGLTFTFMGDIDIDAQGAYNDNSNTVVIAGEDLQYFSNGSGVTANIGNLNIEMSTAGIETIPSFWLSGDMHCNGNIVVDTGNFLINNNTVECVGNFIINENGKVTAPGTSIIAIGSASALTVNEGELELYGDGTNNPKVTAISGNYEFNVMNQGTLATANATFENMDDGGVNIYTTGLVYGTNAFSNCTFRNGIAGGSLLQISNDQNLIINGANFPDNTWSGAYNVSKTFDQGTVTFTNVTGNFAGPAFENDPYNRIGWDEMIPGIWTGAVSPIWNIVGNWQHNLKPTASDDVYIPAGTPNDPWVSSTDQECNNITIEAGASLRIYDEILTVHGDMIIYGELEMDHASGVLNAGDNYGDIISWEASSTDDITSGTINVFSDWYFKNGTNAQLGAGNIVNFYGANRSYIYCDDNNASFGNVTINKTAPPKDFVHLIAGDTLRVSEDLYAAAGALDLFEGSYVNVGNEIYIDNGGTLSAIGMVGNEITVSGYPNYCLLEVASGGTISAEYTIFEYIETTGVTINSGATIDPAHPFNYCTFRESPSGGTLLNIANNQTLTIDGAIFPLNIWNGNYNVFKSLNSGHITFTNVDGGFVGSDYENDPYNLVDWPGVVAGIWTGIHSSIWGVGNNWKYYMEPDSGDDAIIPAGTPHDPVVTFGDQECKSIIIEAGASLEILDHALTVYDDVIIHGELIMNQNASVLNAGDEFGDIISWEPGSTDDITRGNINVYSDWYFKDGTNAQLATGNTIVFYGDNHSYIYCYDSNAEFGNIKVNKTAPPHDKVYVPPNTTIRIGEDLSVDEGVFSMDEGTVLTVQNELYVSDGGTFNVKGASGNEALVSGYPSYAMFEIASGATISAALANFEFFDVNGIYIANGATIDPAYPFYNCTFKESPAGGTLLFIENDQVITIDDASFPTNIWSGSYNVRKISDLGQVTFTNFTGDFSGDSYENDPHNRIDWYHPWYNMNLKVFLEGPFGTTMMATDLNDIPLAQPFNTPPWNYDGLELLGQIPIKMVDWVLVELRDAPSAATATSETMIARKAAVLTNNGYIKDLGGLIDVQFNEPINHNMFVVIWHRNHLGVMSAYHLLNVDGTYSYDFSTYEDQAYGDDEGHKEIAPGIWGMAGGNGNPDEIVDLGDYNLWKLEAGKTGYKMEDFNLDKQVNNKDKNDIWFENRGFECRVPY